MMKRLFADSHKWLMALALVAVAFLACDTEGEEPGAGNEEPNELPELADLVGRWGITEIQSGGNTQTTIPCENTLEVNSSGSFTYVDAARNEWLEGNMAFDSSDSSLTLNINGQQIELKLLSIADGTFSLQFQDDQNGTISLSTRVFTSLESGDCASFTSAELNDKWSIQSFTSNTYELSGAGDDLGTQVGTHTVDDIDENTFTIEFKPDGTAITIDYINEYDYQIGAYRNLDDHNLILTFEQENGENRDELIHLKSRNGSVLVFQSVRYEEGNSSTGTQGQRIVSGFNIAPNSETVASLSSSSLQGKWSTSALARKDFKEGREVVNDTQEGLGHNLMTIDFDDEGNFQYIDLLNEVVVRQGTYEFLDDSNLLIQMNEEGETGAVAPQLYLLRQNTDDQRIVLFNGIRPGVEGQPDLETTEIVLEKNTGNEASITSEELLGNWQVVGVEAYVEPGTNETGPEVGMMLQFENGGSGQVTDQGSLVTNLGYELVDPSNILVNFNDGSGESPDNIFHITTHNGNLLEMVLYAPADAAAANSSGQQAQAVAGPQYRLTFQKL